MMTCPQTVDWSSYNSVNSSWSGPRCLVWIEAISKKRILSNFLFSLIEVESFLGIPNTKTRRAKIKLPPLFLRKHNLIDYFNSTSNTLFCIAVPPKNHVRSDPRSFRHHLRCRQWQGSIIQGKQRPTDGPNLFWKNHQKRVPQVQWDIFAAFLPNCCNKWCIQWHLSENGAAIASASTSTATGATW